jgi:hypothetical protein
MLTVYCIFYLLVFVDGLRHQVTFQLNDLAKQLTGKGDVFLIYLGDGLKKYTSSDCFHKNRVNKSSFLVKRKE